MTRRAGQFSHNLNILEYAMNFDFYQVQTIVSLEIFEKLKSYFFKHLLRLTDKKAINLILGRRCGIQTKSLIEVRERIIFQSEKISPAQQPTRR